ncbi:hypothetical protein N1851_021709 [Merluccius polli]|uniref:HAT C-terminal dimerisation domain-containing protein n=1 Tax=Merluccius polli TaxID=89951 RepID=A0AA47MJ38_MERPO|nr:hypothetical protein N1851_021709 [Merluccius polli]
MKTAICEGTLGISCQKMEVGTEDVDGGDLEFEIRAAVRAFPASISSPTEMLNYIFKENLLDSYPNLSIALRVLLTLPVTVASGERSFSALKLTKTYLRSTMCQERRDLPEGVGAELLAHPLPRRASSGALFHGAKEDALVFCPCPRPGSRRSLTCSGCGQTPASLVGHSACKWETFLAGLRRRSPRSRARCSFSSCILCLQAVVLDTGGAAAAAAGGGAGDNVKELRGQRPSDGGSQTRSVRGQAVLEGLVWLLRLLQQSPWGRQGLRCSLGSAGPRDCNGDDNFSQRAVTSGLPGSDVAAVAQFHEGLGQGHDVLVAASTVWPQNVLLFLLLLLLLSLHFLHARGMEVGGLKESAMMFEETNLLWLLLLLLEPLVTALPPRFLLCIGIGQLLLQHSARLGEQVLHPNEFPCIGVDQREPKKLLGQLVEAVLQLGTVATQRRPLSSLDCSPASILVPPHQALQQVHLKVYVTCRHT